MRRERGMAVIMALLLVALAASAVSLVLWQQNLWWQQVEADRRRAQMQWLLAAQRSWAQARLRQAPVRLPPPWQGRLRDFAWQAQLIDLQSRLNLNAVAAPGGRVSPQRLAVFQRLLARLHLPAELATQLMQWRGLRAAGEHEADSRTLRPLNDWAQLAQVPGYTLAVRQALAPYVTVLPEEVSQVNVNTASPLLLAALLPEAQPAVLAQVASLRQRLPFRDPADFSTRLGLSSPLPAGLLGTDSVMFQLQGSVQQATAQRQVVAVLRREGDRVRLLQRGEPAS